MKVGILSDIHGNRMACKAVLADMAENHVDSVILLGDVIDYGPHSNQVIQLLREFRGNVLCNIYGNHENAIISHRYERFSSDRGRQCAQYTRSMLNAASWDYIKNVMTPAGKTELTIESKKILVIHGCLNDNYWKALKPNDNLEEYDAYDYVFSGHSHLPHFFEIYYHTEDPVHRNKKKTTFVNPGSVGQPRNLCPYAQYVIWDTNNDSFDMKKIIYDIEREQQCFSDCVDVFYKNRLEEGI